MLKDWRHNPYHLRLLHDTRSGAIIRRPIFAVDSEKSSYVSRSTRFGIILGPPLECRWALNQSPGCNLNWEQEMNRKPSSSGCLRMLAVTTMNGLDYVGAFIAAADSEISDPDHGKCMVNGAFR